MARYLILTKSCGLIVCLLLVFQVGMGQSIVQDTLQIDSSLALVNEASAAISSVSGETLRPFLVQRLDHAFQGIIPGLTMLHGEMEPGRQGATLRIRGQSTFQDNNPLIFVDGFEASMDNLSVNEIESVKVLKDAAALAPFGMRGGNGVIWVTTKRGNAGDMNIAFNTRVGISTPFGLPSYLNAYDYARLYNEAVSNDNGIWSAIYDDDALTNYQSQINPLFFPDVDWQKETLNGSVLNKESNLSFSGGFSNVRYYVFLGYLSTPKFYRNSDEEGYLRDKRRTDRYNFRSNVDIKLNKIFDLSATIGGTLLNNARPNISNLWDVISGTPPNAYLPQNPNGTWSGNATYYDNPLGSVFALGRQSNHERKVHTIFTLRENLASVIHGLSLNQSVSFDNRHNAVYNVSQNYARFSPRVDPATRDTVYTQYGNDQPYAIAQDQNQYWRIAYQAGGNYQTSFANHNLSVGTQFRLSQYHVDGNNPPYVDITWSGNFGYTYDDRYIVDLALGMGGSENFARGKRYGFFPALSVAWNLSSEAFLKDIYWINQLKLRSSVGVVGNSDIGGGRFLYQSYYPSGSSYILGTNGTRSVSTLREGVVGNPYVTWERSRIINLGVDASLFDNQLSVSIDAFNDRRNDILARREATSPAILGIDLPYENIGEVQNQGLEAMVSYRRAKGKFSYELSTSFSFARNKILYQDEIVRSESYLYRTGRPIGQLFGLEALGLFQSDAEISDPNTPLHTFAPVRPGDIRYKDQNGDGLINLDDQIPIGYGNIPEITGALNAKIAYSGFDLNLLISGVGNRSVYLSGNNIWAFRNSGQAPEAALNRWVFYPEKGLDNRENASYPRLSASNNANNERISSYWVRNGSFLRVRYAELGYSFRGRWVDDSKLKNLRLFLSGNNLLTWSEDFYGLDPEVTSGGYPMSRGYLLGVNITF